MCFCINCSTVLELCCVKCKIKLARPHRVDNDHQPPPSLLPSINQESTTFSHPTLHLTFQTSKNQPAMPPRTYSKTFIPLESNPEIFTSLAHNLGASSSLKFTEVYSLDERPSNGEVLAYILVFPTSEDYEDNREREGGKEGGRSGKEEGEKEGGGEDVIWLRQTIHNACGLYALLHACCNGRARRSIS